MATLKNAATVLARQLLAMPPGRRLSLGLGVLVPALAVVLLALVVSRPTYAPLMTNLSTEDAAEITAQLTAAHVAYQLAAEGTAVLVPQESVHELRLKLAAAGLPKGGGVGFELFDGASFGQSRFAEKVSYRRALEGELRRTIRQQSGVRDARVHLAVPEPSLFRDREKKARAAVTLQLLPGRRLGEGQVQAIVHLVAASVPDLASDDVTVVDAAGTVLARGEGDGSDSPERALAHERAIERQLEDRVSAILAHAVGAGRSSVRVTAEVDHSRTERTKETFDPETAVIRSEQVNEERRAQTPPPAGGVPGPRTSLAGGADVTAGAADAGSTRRTQTRNYEFSRVTSRELSGPGRLRRLSVAVLIDAGRRATPDGTEEVVARNPEEVARLTELVKSAVGFDASRGDSVVVESMRFELVPEAEPTSAERPAWLDLVQSFWRPALGAVLVIGLLAWLARRRRGGLATQEVIESPRTVRELEAVLARGSLAASGGRSTFPFTEGRPDPRQAAAVLRGWLGDA